MITEIFIAILIGILSYYFYFGKKNVIVEVEQDKDNVDSSNKENILKRKPNNEEIILDANEKDISKKQVNNEEKTSSETEAEIEQQEQTVFQQTWNVLDNNEECETVEVDKSFVKLRHVVKQISEKKLILDTPLAQKEEGVIPDQNKKDPLDTSNNSDKLEEVKIEKEQGSAKPPKKTQKHPEIEIEEEEANFEQKILRKIPKDYEGITLDFPLQKKTIQNLMKDFSDGNVLNIHFVNIILRQIRQLLKYSEPMTEIKIPENGRIVVCGDTHGQLEDVLTIFDINGFPSKTNVFLFNGDFVDRGDCGAEIVLILYCMKLADPDSIFLNRGNHECKAINERYNFENEILQKYDKKTFELFQETFCCLPLCTLVQDTIFILHGGLFRRKDITLEDIRKIKHRRQARSKSSDLELQLIEDILWSDPKSYDPIAPSNRGAGIFFGPTCTNEFLELNKLQLIIRSHELVDGFDFAHQDQLLTVFSASQYCGKNDNKGGFIEITNIASDNSPMSSEESEDDSEVESDSDEIEEAKIYLTANSGKICVKASKFCADLKFSPVKLKEETLDKLKTMIFQKRHHLSAKFWTYDKRPANGFIPKVKWAKGLEKILKLDIPWLPLQPHLAEIESDGTINYIKFLERYRIQDDNKNNDQWKETVIDNLCAKMFRKNENLSQAFEKYDTNGDGHISYKEFVSALVKMDLGISKDQIYDVMRFLDSDFDNSISYEEFVSGFQVQFDFKKQKKESNEEVISILTEIGGCLFKTAETNLEETFKQFDLDKNGSIEYQEFITVVQDVLKLNYSNTQLEKVLNYIDADDDGHIDYKEFASAFKVVNTGNDKWQTSLIDSIYSVLLENKLQLRKVYKMLDPEQTGSISLENFMVGLESVNVLLGDPLSSAQLQEIFKTMEVDGDEIDYNKFLESFRVVDTNVK